MNLVVAMRLLLSRHMMSLVLATSTAATLNACCAVNPDGSFVAFGDQTNIVIWNERSQTEHFIRNASFQSNASNFGFIAPTPTKPELGEASVRAFNMLAALKPRPFEFELMPSSSAKAMDDVASVAIVQSVAVAGYQATTLLATDATALAYWMKENGYSTTPGIEAWTKPYISKGWYLTAFKVQNSSSFASTGTVRMSFTTDKPFNPFLVPQDNLVPGKTGTLHLYFVSNGSFDGSVAGKGWVHESWSSDVPEDAAFNLARELSLPASAIPEGARVQMFQDSFPQPAADDIFFTRRNDFLKYLGALLLLGSMGYGVYFLIQMRRRSRGLVPAH